MEIGSVIIRGTATQTAKTAFQVASGLTTERPTGVAAMMRFNTTLGRFEGHNGTGWNVIDGVGSVTSVSLSTPSTGLQVTSGGPITGSGTLTITLAGELAALNALSSNGLVARTGTATYANRTVAASSAAGSQGISLSNADGVAGNPTIGLNITGLTAAGSISLANTLVINDGANNVKATFTQVKSALGVPTIYRTSFTNASLNAGVLTVTHNIGQQFVQVIVTDNNNKALQPDDITMTSGTALAVDLSSFGTLTGNWNVMVIG